MLTFLDYLSMYVSVILLLFIILCFVPSYVSRLNFKPLYTQPLGWNGRVCKKWIFFRQLCEHSLWGWKGHAPQKTAHVFTSKEHFSCILGLDFQREKNYRLLQKCGSPAIGTDLNLFVHIIKLSYLTIPQLLPYSYTLGQWFCHLGHR